MSETAITDENQNKRCCNLCGSPSPRFSCAKCNRVAYCDKNCQVSDWAKHKMSCRMIDKAKASPLVWASSDLDAEVTQNAKLSLQTLQQRTHIAPDSALAKALESSSLLVACAQYVTAKDAKCDERFVSTLGILSSLILFAYDKEEPKSTVLAAHMDTEFIMSESKLAKLGDLLEEEFKEVDKSRVRIHLIGGFKLHQDELVNHCVDMATKRGFGDFDLTLANVFEGVRTPEEYSREYERLYDSELIYMVAFDRKLAKVVTHSASYETVPNMKEMEKFGYAALHYGVLVHVDPYNY